jgi:glycosyltransferase involved in cell wall biosynthesis
VSTSLSDAGIAASTAEAMACGLPVVITDFGDNGRWVKNGEGGFLFRPGDHEALAQAIVWLLTHEGARSAFGRVNRTTIEQHNDYEKEMAKMERLYEELCVQPNAT